METKKVNWSEAKAALETLAASETKKALERLSQGYKSETTLCEGMECLLRLLDGESQTLRNYAKRAKRLYGAKVKPFTEEYEEPIREAFEVVAAEAEKLFTLLEYLSCEHADEEDSATDKHVEEIRKGFEEKASELLKIGFLAKALGYKISEELVLKVIAAEK